MNEEHEQRLAEAFVALADTLLDDFDVLDFLNTLAVRAADLFDVSAAGVVLSDQRGGWPPRPPRSNRPACSNCCQPRPTMARAATAFSTKHP